jgi:hypothetical protein
MVIGEQSWVGSGFLGFSALAAANSAPVQQCSNAAHVHLNLNRIA